MIVVSGEQDAKKTKHDYYDNQFKETAVELRIGERRRWDTPYSSCDTLPLQDKGINGIGRVWS